MMYSMRASRWSMNSGTTSTPVVESDGAIGRKYPEHVRRVQIPRTACATAAAYPFGRVLDAGCVKASVNPLLVVDAKRARTAPPRAARPLARRESAGLRGAYVDLCCSISGALGASSLAKRLRAPARGSARGRH